MHMSPATRPRHRPTVASIDTDHPVLTPSNSNPPSARSTLGSPLTTHAVVRRSGTGDLAAGPRRRNSLSEVEVLPWLCCMLPAFSTFGFYGLVLVTACFAPTFNYWLTAILTLMTMFFLTNATLSTFAGAYFLRQGTQQDWQAMLEEVQQVDPDGSTVLHIVILPNYKENERMLKETLENIGCSPLATTRVRVVLAMEAREGAGAHEKADRLIQQTSHLFSDIIATYHPNDVPGEVAGKSSNTMFAYREALRHYGPVLLGYDLSRVFLTVGDADTLWHPQYFSAISYSALMMAHEERVWRIWQSPVLLLRNLRTVPQLTRCTAHGALVFELSGLANQAIAPALAYSSYTLTLALASHPEVDGWDVDVIAEDHHMFCKCFFASLWEQAHAAKDANKQWAKIRSPVPSNEGMAPIVIEPQVQVEPVYLPSVSFLVESSAGYWPSLWARFQQARRHSQGVIELGYVALMYTRLVHHAGFRNIPWKTHRTILSIMWKIHTLHITTSAQCFALVVTLFTNLLPAALQWVWSGGLSQLMEVQILSMAMNRWDALDTAQRAVFAGLSQISGLTVIYSIIVFIVILSLLEGHYHRVLSPVPPTRAMLPVAEGDDGDTSEVPSPVGHANASSPHGQSESNDMDKVLPTMPSFVEGPMSWCQRAHLMVEILVDSLTSGFPTVFFFACVPLLLAAWSLFRRGTDFEYIVGEKPE